MNRIVASAVGVILVVAGFVLVRSGGDDSPASGNLADPQSTSELRGPGSAVFGTPSIDLLPEFSHAVVLATVVDVQRSKFNTPTGGLPAGSFTPDNRRAYQSLDAFTPVVVSVEKVLAANSMGDLADISTGNLEILVPGGVVEFFLRSDLAEVFAPSEDEREPGEADLSDGYDTARGVSSSVLLTEGDRVVLFLAYQVSEYVSDDWSISSNALLIPIGAPYRLAGDGLAVASFSAGELRVLAEDVVFAEADRAKALTSAPRSLELLAPLIRSMAQGR